MIVNEQDVIRKAMSAFIDTAIYKTVSDRKGMPNVLFTVNGSSRFMHSSYDAVSDGIRFAEANYVGNSDIAVIGMGLGYHIKPLIAKLKPQQKLYIFETDPVLLRIALENSDIHDCLSSENVVFCACSLSDTAKYYFNCISQKAAFIYYNPIIDTIPGYLHIITQYNQIINNLNNSVQKSVTLDDVKRNFNYVPIKRIKKYRVMIFEFENNDSIIKSFIESWILAFKYLGCEVTFIPNDIDKLTQFFLHDDPFDSVDFFVTCNDSKANLSMYDMFNIPIISVEIDRPFATSCLMNQYKTKNVIYTWPNNADLKHVGLYYELGTHYSMAHGGEVNFDPTVVFNIERPLDVVISCNYTPDVPFGDFGYADTRIDRKMIDRIIKNYRASDMFLDDCVADVMCEDFDDETLRQFMYNDGFKIESLIRRENKYNVIKALLDNGISVHLFGENWNLTDIVNYPNCSYYGSIECDRGRMIFERCKILINILPASPGIGAHERVFSSMLRGALCVSSFTNYLREVFSENNEIVLFKYSDLNDLARKVKYYLDHEDERLRITKNAFSKVRANHTWINRAEKMIDMYEKFVREN